MRKILAGAFVAAAMTFGMAGITHAGDNYNQNPNASACGQEHGAFGAFGKDNNLAGGANGQATGAANSAKGCQNNYPVAP